MKKDITYNWGEDHILISLGNRVQRGIRVFFIVEFMFTVAMATIFLLQSMPFSAGFTHVFAGVCSVLIYPLATYRFLSRVFFNEQILVEQRGITIIRRTPFYRDMKSYYWSSIGPIHYVGRHKKTDHPLKGKYYDYFGFEAQENLIQSLHHNGNLFFNCGRNQVHFARGVYSWDAEKLVYMMKLYVGKQMQLGPEWEQMLQEHEMDY
jgi:hypothetical protein